MSVNEGMVSVVVPVYNSEATIEELIRRLDSVFAEQGSDWEVILVNDGSRDNSWKVAQSIARQNTHVCAINLMRNYGQHNALLAGIRQANGSVIVTMDDDLQHPPEEVPNLLAALGDEYDVVYGKPQTEKHGAFRDSASVLTKLALQSVLGYKHASNTSAFRVFKTYLRDGFSAYESNHVSIDVLLNWSTTRFGHIVVAHDERKHGQSNYNVRKLVAHALNMVTGFSTVPLRVATMIGFSFVTFGFIILAYILIRYFISDVQVPGFTFLASIVSIFSGVQLFSLGIIGEYIGRIHIRALNQPPFVIRQVIADGRSQENIDKS